MRAAFRPGTRSNLRTQLKSYLLFCTYFRKEPFPATSLQLRCYAQFISRTLKSPQSIQNYLSGIKTAHMLYGHSTSAFAEPDVKLTLSGISKSSTHTSLQRLPVTPQMLQQMHRHIDQQDELDVTIYAAILIMFFAFLRRSNIAPKSAKSFDKHRNLLRQDIIANDSGLEVIVRWSKTIQCSERVLSIPLVAIPSSPLCPVTAYKAMLRKIPASPKQPAFVVHDSHGRCLPLTQSQLTKRFDELISILDLDSKVYSLHSLRRGGATFARLSGASIDAIKTHGDWKSNAVELYIKIPFSQRLTVTQDMANLIVNER